MDAEIVGLTIKRRREDEQGDAAKNPRTGTLGTPQGSGAVGSGDAPPATPNLTANLTTSPPPPPPPHMGSLPATVGEGEHEQPLMEAVLQGMRGMALDIQGLKAALYDSWEANPKSNYVTSGLELNDLWNSDCRTKKGTNIGDNKNYVLFGLYKAAMEDPKVTQEEKDLMKGIVGPRIKNAAGQYEMDKLKNLADLVGHCAVSRTKNRKRAFVNIMMRPGEGQQVGKVLYEAITRDAERMWDSSVPQPIHKNLKDALAAARAKRR